MFIFLVLILIICFGLFYLNQLKQAAKKDTRPRMAILQYLKKQKAIDFDSAIKMRDLPKDVAQSPALLMLVQEGTLRMEKGRYFLNKK